MASTCCVSISSWCRNAEARSADGIRLPVAVSRNAASLPSKPRSLSSAACRPAPSLPATAVVYPTSASMWSAHSVMNCCPAGGPEERAHRGRELGRCSCRGSPPRPGSRGSPSHRRAAWRRRARCARRAAGPAPTRSRHDGWSSGAACVGRQQRGGQRLPDGERVGVGGAVVVGGAAVVAGGVLVGLPEEVVDVRGEGAAGRGRREPALRGGREEVAEARLELARAGRGRRRGRPCRWRRDRGRS